MQRRGRVEADRDERGAGGGRGPERLGLPVGPVQGPDVVHPQRLVERIKRGELFQLAQG
ncbi:hypothetical protein GCM10027610_062720 [Dactylosporangium cerinum]